MAIRIEPNVDAAVVTKPIAAVDEDVDDDAGDVKDVDGAVNAADCVPVESGVVAGIAITIVLPSTIACTIVVIEFDVIDVNAAAAGTTQNA